MNKMPSPASSHNRHKCVIEALQGIVILVGIEKIEAI